MHKNIQERIATYPRGLASILHIHTIALLASLQCHEQVKILQPERTKAEIDDLDRN